MIEPLIPQDPIILGIGEPVKGKTYIADGYVYRDLPRMTEPYYSDFINLLGDDNIVWLTKAAYPDGTQRGQILISIAGQQRIIDHNANKGKR